MVNTICLEKKNWLNLVRVQVYVVSHLDYQSSGLGFVV